MSATGNEFSHEYAHDHGLPRSPGGEELSTHSRSGAWGFNLFKNRLIGNFAWNGQRPEGDFPYGYGFDAMAGGEPMGVVSVFTLHTHFSLNAIQSNVGGDSGVLDDTSPTGYRKWDAKKQEMIVSTVDSSLHQAMEDYFGTIAEHEPGVDFEVGKVYRHRDGTYYQVGPPRAGEDKFSSRKLGDTQAFVSMERLSLDIESKDYAQAVMKGKSGVHNYVSVDGDRVIQSDAPSSKSATWYAKGDYSKITVNALSSQGDRQAIVLRGQINNAHVLNRGAPVGESSRARFSFHEQDNPEVAKGKYQVEFPVYAYGWHVDRLVECFRVVGIIAVK